MERVYTIPLRKALRAPRTRRAKKAIKLVREFLERHMKGEVKIGKSINESVWARGIQKPPGRIKVKAVKKDGVIYAELLGTEIKLPEKKAEKKEKTEGKAEKVKENGKEKAEEQVEAQERSGVEKVQRGGKTE